MVRKYYELLFLILTARLGQTGPVGNGTAAGDGTADADFLTRERAALGEDAAQFSTTGDHNATLQDDDDDLLGGGDYSGANVGGEEITEFESSFPTIDTHNDVNPDLEMDFNVAY